MIFTLAMRIEYTSLRYGSVVRAQKSPDGVGCGLLHRLQDMAVSVQRDLGGRVTVAFAHHFGMHPGQQSDGGCGVAKIMECDFRQARSTLQGVEVAGQASRMEGSPNSSTNT